MKGAYDFLLYENHTRVTMTKKLYQLMDWAAIEGIVYSEEDEPHQILGPHKAKGGILFQMFYPNAKHVTLVIGKNLFHMELVDEAGFFAALIPKNVAYKGYYYIVETDKGIQKEIYDPYGFEPIITMEDTDKFNMGVHTNIYDVLGSHKKVVDGIQGIHFALWAPNAQRVSVVGDFNNWDGRMHQMRRLWDSGIFEIFLPLAHINDNYKYEIKLKNGTTYLKADPYAKSAQLRPETASIVYDLTSFTWDDETWLKQREKSDYATQPLSILTLSLALFAKKDNGDFLSYKELAPKIISYVKEMGYTHIQLKPVMEHPSDQSLGYQVVGAYAPTKRHGQPEDFMYFVNEMHKNQIGVILEWVCSDFPTDEHGLSGFDGTCLYGHLDERRKMHPIWNTCYFNYGRPEVKNYLLSNAMYWIKEYHVDGLYIDELASMLYLDYERQNKGYTTNMYGGVENLEAIDFIKQFNQIIHTQYPGVLSIAELNAAWPKVTAHTAEDGLGFDFTWNHDFANDTCEYFKFDPIYRAHHHDAITFSFVYAFREKYMLSYKNKQNRNNQCSIIRQMPGEIEDKFKNAKAFFSFMMMHPGVKQFFLGQDIGEFRESYTDLPVEWDLLTQEQHKQMQLLVKQLNIFYQTHEALYRLDQTEEGFAWINSISAEENVLAFVRKSQNEKDTLLVVCNFANEKRDDYRIGVPFAGKYKECFNSDAKQFGGTNCINGKPIITDEIACDAKTDSISFIMAPLAVQVFSYTSFTAKEKAEIEKKREEERKRQLELADINQAKLDESNARKMALEAREEAQRAQLAAKEALKHAMSEAKKAEELEKQARELEKQAVRLHEKSEVLIKNAKFLKPSDLKD